jgi:hypothetical protein
MKVDLRQGSHRGHAVDEEKVGVRNNPPSGDGGLPKKWNGTK